MMNTTSFRKALLFFFVVAAVMVMVSNIDNHIDCVFNKNVEVVE